MPGEATRVTLLVTQTLERLGILYAVGGSLASSLHGVMRSTLDVDIVADVRLEHIQPLAAALAHEFYVDAEMIREAIARHGSFNLIHYETAFKVDIFVCKPRDFDRMQLERRQKVHLATDLSTSIYVVSPEDIVLAKLEWYRLGNQVSDRQWRDIVGVLKTRQGELNLAYLRKWAHTLEVGDLLERALAEVEDTGTDTQTFSHRKEEQANE